MASLLCRKFQERHVHLKEEEKCFLDPFFPFFSLGFLCENPTAFTMGMYTLLPRWLSQCSDAGAEKDEGPNEICYFFFFFSATVSCVPNFPCPNNLISSLAGYHENGKRVSLLAGEDRLSSGWWPSSHCPPRGFGTGQRGHHAPHPVNLVFWLNRFSQLHPRLYFLTKQICVGQKQQRLVWYSELF